ncbi:MAG: hypothetical protein PVF14_02045, partial [Desulfobacterales bacterium]
IIKNILPILNFIGNPATIHPSDFNRPCDITPIHRAMDVLKRMVKNHKINYCNTHMLAESATK